jgi:two-component system LytT family response regulator
VIRTLIVEDAPLARAALQRLLKPHGDVTVVGEAASVAEALAAVLAHKPDLLLLDVELPDGTGLDVARALVEPKPAIVFLTAYAEHALPAFAVEALDYLLKPAGPEDMNRALDRVRRALERPRHSPAVDEHLEIRDGARKTFVATKTIEWVDTAGHYLCVHAQGQVHLIRTPIAELADRLGTAFVRVHRTALVKLDRVASIVDRRNGDGDVHLIGGAIVPLSRTYRADLERRLAAAKR